MTVVASKVSLQHRRVIPFDTDWLFTKGNYAGAKNPGFDDSRWRRLDVPHDWSIEEAFDPEMEHGSSHAYLPRWTVAWYRKKFTLDEADQARRIVIEFDGVHNNSEVWINGHYLGSRPYGYVPFQYDLTPYLHRDGENVLSVKVDNTVMPPDRWYSGSGIYRHVRLLSTDPVQVAQWGTYITTPQVSEASAKVVIRTNVRNGYAEAKACTVTTEIVDADGAVVGRGESKAVVPGGETAESAQEIRVETPKRWSPEQPSLYHAYTTVAVDGQVTDDYITPFGIREIRFDSREGFFLSGVGTKLKGVCIHHDLGCLGAAYNDRAMERRLAVLKEMGCNAVRFAHNPMAAELLDLCDRMGFLVVDEAFDKWKSLYYAELFDEWWQADLEAMLLRDRNHPSIFLWSVGNEVEQQGQDSMLEMLDLLVKHCHTVDPTRPVTCALEPHNWPMSLRSGTVEEKVAHTRKLAERVDILGLNYQEQWYEQYREAMPDTLILGTETFPFYRGKGSRVKGYEPVNPWFDVVKHDYVIGQFVWAGIDYLGESAYPSKGWSSGLIDTCGFRKPVSYLQESLWSEEPMVQIAVFDDTLEQGHTPQWTKHWMSPPMASHWTFPHYEGRLLRLVTFTNCESVELVVGDESYEEKRLADHPDRLMVWHLPYAPGRVKAVGRIGGRIVCTHELVTAGEARQLTLQADRTRLAADGIDLAHVEVIVTDEQGVPVPGAKHAISFTLEGEGTILGVDNGDLNSDEPYKANARSAYHGRCLVVVQAGKQAGTLELTASAEGLEAAAVTIVCE
ncbi:beta-galactosidase [Paenibacillus mucilaginosus]|uniref:sugar-binding domain-containing protein n=1 Tax=Paenibacillus mucilaginosus TaxID=61624 RepID=UPI003D211648